MDAMFQLHQYIQTPDQINFDEICRLCGSSKGVMSYIFSSTGVDTSVPLSTRIMNFANVQITEGDGLPSLVCHRCLYHVEKVNEFKQLCEQSDALLRQYLAVQTEAEKRMSNKKFFKTECNGVNFAIKQEPGEEDKGTNTVEDAEDLYETDEDSEFNCPNCNKHFDCSENLNRHALIHTQEGPFPCDYCSLVEKDKASLRTHWRTEHAGSNPHVCQTCGESFGARDGLTRHNERHDRVKPYHCTVCGKAFSYKSDLRKHAIIHSGVRPYVCPICYKSFTRSTNLNKHCRLHTGRRPFPCGGCNKMFASRGDLVRHSVIHTGEKPYTCTVCHISFNRKDKLSRHEKLHIGERPHTCTVCPTSFNRKEELTKHVQFHHFTPEGDIDDDSVVAEDLSGFSKKSNFHTEDGGGDEGGGSETEDVVISVDPSSWAGDNSQSSSQSGGEANSSSSIGGGEATAASCQERRDFVCTICMKGFRQRRELVRHSTVHTGYRPHPCNICGKAFARTDKLKRHLRTHTSSKKKKGVPAVTLPRPQCEICFKVLSSKHELRRHLLTHSLYKPYQCSLCSSSYCRKDKLVKHIKRVHPPSSNTPTPSSDTSSATPHLPHSLSDTLWKLHAELIRKVTSSNNGGLPLVNNIAA